MGTQHLVIIGGGLAGLSAGCYALRSGFRTTIIEHNSALGGVCTAWKRGPYIIDGCIQWLTGGAFSELYEELDIVPHVPLRTLEHWFTYRHVKDAVEIAITRDLDGLVRSLTALSSADAKELHRLRVAARELGMLRPSLDAREVSTLRDRLRALWEGRDAASSLLHFRKPVGVWAREHLESERLQRVFVRLLPEQVPTLFLVMVLGYLEKGYLSRPVGGTAAFRDALVETYRSEGGEVVLPATVEEVLVEHGRARGVRLADGTMLEADFVLSTASAPETVLHLLGGRYEPEPTQKRLETWPLFEPLVLASFGVEQRYADLPSMQVIDGVEPFDLGGRRNDRLELRICNDDPSFAPAGHCVVQVMLKTKYESWATRGASYESEKDTVAETTLRALEPFLPDLRSHVRMVDVATPLTFWSAARSWRGAYEGWLPTPEAFFSHPKKTLSGLSGFYMAGQWVEPGGGVPTALMSGRQAVQLLCADTGSPFVSHRSRGVPKPPQHVTQPSR